MVAATAEATAEAATAEATAVEVATAAAVAAVRPANSGSTRTQADGVHEGRRHDTAVSASSESG